MQFFLLNSPHNIVIYWFSPLFDWAEKFKDLVFVKHFSLFCSAASIECGNPRMRNFSKCKIDISQFTRRFSIFLASPTAGERIFCLMKIKINVINNESCHSFRICKISTAAEYSTRNFSFTASEQISSKFSFVFWQTTCEFRMNKSESNKSCGDDIRCMQQTFLSLLHKLPRCSRQQTYSTTSSSFCKFLKSYSSFFSP